MTPEERRRMNWLCKRIQRKNPMRFGELITELNELLARGRPHYFASRTTRSLSCSACGKLTA